MFGVVAVLFVASSVYALTVASWTVIAHDQWRIYADLLFRPFPANVLAEQNGHRPIVKNVLSLIDIYLFGARNLFLSTVGLTLAGAFAAWWTLIATSADWTRPSAGYIAGGIMWIFVFWLGNGRTLAHGNELVNVFPTLLGLLLATHALLQLETRDKELHQKSELLWLTVAVGGCVIATFSFGLGIITWPVALLMALILRRRFYVPCVLLLGCAGMVSIFLTGRQTRLAVQSLSQSGTFEITRDAMTWLGAPLHQMLRWGNDDLAPLALEVLCPVFGGVVLVVTVWLVSMHVVKGCSDYSTLRLYGLAFLLFGVGSALLIATVRGAYFDQFPGQLVGPRYLPWSSVTWAAFLGVVGVTFSKLGQWRQVVTGAWITGCFALAILLLPSHHLRNIDFKKQRMLEAAYGLVTEVEDDELVAAHLFRRPRTVYRVADFLRSNSSRAVSGPVIRQIGEKFDTLYSVREEAELGVLSFELDHVEWKRSDALRFSGTVDDWDGVCSRVPRVVVVDDDGIIAGSGLLRVQDHGLARRFGLLARIKTGFFGYLREPEGFTLYRIYAVDPETSFARRLKSFSWAGERSGGKSESSPRSELQERS